MTWKRMPSSVTNGRLRQKKGNEANRNWRRSSLLNVLSGRRFLMLRLFSEGLGLDGARGRNRAYALAGDGAHFLPDLKDALLFAGQATYIVALLPRTRLSFSPCHDRG